jgi:hypothetical protein
MRAFLVILFLLTSVKAYADSFIDDRLNGLNTSTPVSGFWAGFGIEPEVWIGPRFTLREQTRLTEIGVFVTHFGPLPVVSILPQINGVPDISTTLATLTLSNNFPTGTMAFESVSPNLLLGAGTYYAIFKPQGAEFDGILLSNIQDPGTEQILYRAVPGPGGFIRIDQNLVVDEPAALAVRLTGEVSVPEPATISLFAIGLIPAMLFHLDAARMKRSWTV